MEEDPSGEIVRPENWVPELLNDASAVREITTSTRLFRGRLGVATSRPQGGGCRYRRSKWERRLPS